MIPRCYHCNKELDSDTERFIQVDGRGFSFCGECLKEFQEKLDTIINSFKYQVVRKEILDMMDNSMKNFKKGIVGKGVDLDD